MARGKTYEVTVDGEKQLVRLIRPGYEWDETDTSIRLVPVCVDRLWDAVERRPVRLSLARGGQARLRGFVAMARCRGAHPWAPGLRCCPSDWVVTKQGTSPGGRRYEVHPNQEAAMADLVGWYQRRFRYMERVG